MQILAIPGFYLVYGHIRKFRTVVTQHYLTKDYFYFTMGGFFSKRLMMTWGRPIQVAIKSLVILFPLILRWVFWSEKILPENGRRGGRIVTAPEKRQQQCCLLSIVLLLVVFCGSTAVYGEIVDFSVTRVEPAFGGKAFGKWGRYLRIRGVATGLLDPSDPRNTVIVDLDKAPVDHNGLVKYKVDVVIMRPEQGGNGSLVYSVTNRSRFMDLYFFNWNREYRFASNQLAVEDAGDGLVMNEGFTFVWSAWDGSIQPGDGVLVADFPVALADSKPLEGMNLVEFSDTGTEAVFTAKLSHPVADQDTTRAILTVRQFEADARKMPGDLHFSYENDETLTINRPAGFDSGAIYEFIYPAFDITRIKGSNGKVIDKNGIFGIGFAGIRDLVSFLRHDETQRNPASEVGINRALIYGYSQSGRMIKDFIYEGFNEDEKGRIVFEGAMPSASGAARSYINWRFAKPGNYTTQHRWHLQPGDHFPFTYGVIHDPITGKSDGILNKCGRTETCPKIMHVDTGSEIRDRRASLVVTDPLGQKDLVLPGNVRVYWLASSTHIPFNFRDLSTTSKRRPGQYGVEVKNLTSPVDIRPAQRALLLALDSWIANGTRPPESSYGKINDGTLVSMNDIIADFPSPIPGFTFTANYNAIQQTDYVLTDDPLNPYRLGSSYKVLFSAIDEIGNEIPGIQLPRVANPIGTYTGWNPREAGHGENDLAEAFGSWAPLTDTRESRLKTGDSRLSLEERYGGHDEWVARVRHSANELVRKGYLLPRDRDTIVAQAVQQEF